MPHPQEGPGGRCCAIRLDALSFSRSPSGFGTQAWMPGISRMKFTQYFEAMRARPDCREILREWMEFVVLHPESEQVQSDGRIRRWARIEKAGSRYLRVVLLPDGETVHNAFFDRNYER